MKTIINKVLSVVIVLAIILSQMAFVSFATSEITPVSISAVAQNSLIENCDGYWSENYDSDTGIVTEYFYYDVWKLNSYFTVTMSDGSVIYGSSWEIQEKLNWNYDISVYAEQNYNNQLSVGSHIATAELYNCRSYEKIATCEFEFDIIENPIESLEVQPATIIEKTDGYWTERYNEETGEYEEYFHYYLDNFKYAVTLKDGTVIESDDYGYFQYNGQIHSLNSLTDQSKTPLTVSKHEIEVSVLGYETSTTIEIIENPIAKIETESTTITEYTKGSWSSIWNDYGFTEYFYYYNVDDIIKFKVILKDGTVLNPYKKGGNTYIELNGKEYDVSFSHDQYSKQWSVGAHSVDIWLLGVKGTSNIEIVSGSDCPYAYDEIDGGVVITGVNDINVKKVEIPEMIYGKPVIGIASLGVPYATEIIVPDSVKFLSKTWLYNCVRATSVTLGKSVKQLTVDMFSTTYSLKNINVSEENHNFKSIDGVAYSKDGSTLIAYPLGKSDTYNVPSGVRNIEIILSNNIYDELNINFTDDSDGFITLDGITYTSDMKTVVYCNPSKTGNYTMPNSVDEIYDRAFANSALESVKISKNVNEIVYGAFADCSSLQNVEIPDSVKSIGKQAFANCDALDEIALPDGITELGLMAFSDCDALKEITIPDSVINLGGSSFDYCDALKTVVLGNGIETIPGSFSSCESLENVTLPDTLKEIGSGAFSYCTNLKEIILPESLEIIGNVAFASSGLTSIEIPDGVAIIDGAFAECEYLKSVILPSDMKEIASNCFRGCYSLNSIIIPNSVEKIGHSAFEYCKNLANITIPNSVTKIEGYAFSNCRQLSEINGANNVENVGVEAFSNTAYISNNANYENGILYIGKVLYTSKNEISGDIEVKAGTKSITDYALKETNITSVVLPEGLEHIGRAAFENCSKLSSANFPEGLKVVDEGAFEGTAIESIKMPSTVTDLVYATFRDSKVSEIDMPDIPVSLGGCDFDNTPWYDAQTDGVMYVDDVVLYGYKGKMPENTTIKVKNGTLTMAGYAFDDETNLTGITFPDGFVEIGQGALASCTGLEEITLPDSVKRIRSTALANCTSLKTISLGSGLEVIEYFAFGNCSALTSINIPASVERIDTNAFDGCSLLKEINVDQDNKHYSSVDGILYNKEGTEVIYCPIGKSGTVTLGSGVERVADYAFKDAKVKKIIIENDELEIGEYAFATTNGKHRGQINAILLCAASGSTTETYAENIGQLFEVKINNPTEPDDPITPQDPCENGHTWSEWATEGNKMFRDCTVCGFEEYKIMVEGGEVEIESPKQPDSDFDVEHVEDENNDRYILAERAIGSEDKILKLFDITLKNNEVIHVQPNGTVKVKLPLDWEKNGNYKVYRVNDDGTLTDMNAYRQGSHMVFETDHFSLYVIVEETNYSFSIQTPSITKIRHKDGIKLHTKLEGAAPDGSYVKWTASNDNFKTEEINDGGSLKIISAKNGKTTFTAILYSADHKVLATDTIEMNSKAGFFDKIGSFFRSLFGGTKIHES